MHCENCGTKNADLAKFCTSCGSAIKSAVSSNSNTFENIKEQDDDLVFPSEPPKSPIVAALLSFLLSGVGQFYLGQKMKFLGIFVLAVLLFMSGVLIPVMPLIWIAMIFDAYFIGCKLRKGKSVKQWEFF